MEKWREQFSRTSRWLVRFAAQNAGQPHDRESDYYVDEVYAFFQNCYHLKDWLKNDASLDESVRNDVENHINDNRSLQLCADLCNSLKHLTLNRPRSSESPGFGGRQFGLTVGTEPATLSIRYTIETSSGSLDGYGLAQDCVRAWEDFFKKWNLS